MHDRTHQMRNRLSIYFFAIGMLVPVSGMAEQNSAKKNDSSAVASATARAEQLYDQGVAAADKKQWAKAREFFKEAFELDNDPQIAANLGNAELELGEACAAANHFDYFLQKKTDASKKDREQIKALYDKAAAQIVVVDLSVDQVGADLFVNGAFIGLSPLNRRLFLKPGPYMFQATMAGTTPGSQEIELARGSGVVVKLRMGEVVEKVVLPKGTVQTQPREINWRLPLFIGLGGLALTGIGVGLGSMVSADRYGKDYSTGKTILASSTPDIYADPCDDSANASACKRLDVVERRAAQTRDIGIVSFVVGGASLVTVGMFVLIPRLRKKRIGVMPVLGRDQMGVIVEGTIF